MSDAAHASEQPLAPQLAPLVLVIEDELAHERFDGRGYPDRLRGDGIPLGARIVVIADANEGSRTGGRTRLRSRTPQRRRS